VSMRLRPTFDRERRHQWITDTTVNIWPNRDLILSSRVPERPARGGAAGIYDAVATWFTVIGPQVPLDLAVCCPLIEIRTGLPELVSVLSRKFGSRVSIHTLSVVSTLSLPPRRARRNTKSWFGGRPNRLSSMVVSIGWTGVVALVLIRGH